MQQGDIDRLRLAAVPAQVHWIAGRAIAESPQPLAVINPIDGSEITTIADGSARDMNIAVAAARSRFEDGAWSRAAPADRKKRMFRLAELLEKHAFELAVLGVRDNGTVDMAYKAEPLSAVQTFGYYAEAIDKVYARLRPRRLASSGSCTMSRLARSA